MRNKRLFIYCAGGFGRETLKLARTINEKEKKWTEICFVDDNKTSEQINGVPVWCAEQWLNERNSDDSFIVATGEPMLRMKIAEKIYRIGGRLDTLIHPGFEQSQFHQVAEGTIITEGNIFTDNISIGKCGLINLGCCVGHDVVLGDFVTLSPGTIVSGEVTIGTGTYIGTGAIIRDGVNIGENCVIGMGSLVTKDIPDNVIAYGSPCRIIGENKGGTIFR